ncbi:radical SAM protein, partial [bacterium]|nr:radical SAM protein [bacterium]
EISRGCPFTCAYCVETVIQDEYKFHDKTKLGVLKSASNYIRMKSIEHVLTELTILSLEHDIRFLRFQDTNFLSTDRDLLRKMIPFFKSHPQISSYIETRPETINTSSVQILMDLNVVGVGMGVEVSAEGFRSDNLDRFCPTSKIVEAFKLLRANRIRRTAYNIIGLPDQTEEDILSTIQLNAMIDPDDITVAYYSPYVGTKMSKIAFDKGVYSASELYADGQIDTTIDGLSGDVLRYYKSNFVDLVKGMI